MIPPERRRLRTSGGEMAFVDVGDGPPVLLLHGFPTWSYLWRREIWLLSQRMRVIAPDLLGYGESAKPPAAALSEQQQERYVQELLEQLGIDSLAAVGHDIGGAVAQMLALDEGGPAVGALVLVDSVAFDASPTHAVRMMQDATADQVTPDFVESIVGLTFDIGMRHRDRLSEDDLHEYLRPWMADPEALFRAARGIAGKGLAGREEDFAALDIPVLILWGEDDLFVPVETAERLGELIPGSTTGLLPGCSHFVMEDAPSTVGPLISEYLRARYLRETHQHATGPVPVFLERPPPELEFDPADGEGP